MQTLQEIWNRVQIESEESTLGSGFFGLQSKIRFLKILIKGMHNPVLDLGIRIWIVQMERTLSLSIYVKMIDPDISIETRTRPDHRQPKLILRNLQNVGHYKTLYWGFAHFLKIVEYCYYCGNFPPRFYPSNTPRIALKLHTTHKYKVN